MRILDRLRLEYLIVHHTVSPDGKTLNGPAVVRWHVEHNGWPAVGYHVMVEDVRGDTAVVQWGRGLHYAGAHCKEDSMNFRSWGLCVVGNYDDNAPPSHVWDAAIQTAAILCMAGGIPIANIRPHREFATYKSCPGKQFDMTKFRNDVGAFLLTKVPRIIPSG